MGCRPCPTWDSNWLIFVMIPIWRMYERMNLTDTLHRVGTGMRRNRLAR
jgi:hypothetical protein